MPKYKSNEWEFQGEVLKWLQQEIAKRSGMGLDKATQEPSKITGHRSDLIIWQDRSAEVAFLSWELKTPETPITSPVLLKDACIKAQRWGAPFFAIWNMQVAELYRTPAGREANPSDRVCPPFPLNDKVGCVDDWLNNETAKTLQHDALAVFEEAWQRYALGAGRSIEIDASVFVDKLGVRLYQLRQFCVSALEAKATNSGAVRKRLKEIAAEQGFASFVEDVQVAIGGQYAYRLVGQILFYFALRRKQPSLAPLVVNEKAKLPDALRPFWDDVRRFDYEALFKSSELDSLIPLSSAACLVVRQLILELGAYDWNRLRDDVLGAVFENLIPKQEQHLLGQFYTPTRVADLLVAFTVDGENPLILDPGCGSGTFLMRAYDYLRCIRGNNHSEILSRVWGFDISPFAAELAAINLFRQDMAVFDNYPRIVSGNFFDRTVGEEVPFPPARLGGQDKVVLEIPQFNAIIGNPPYLRSQNQDDLNESYKHTLFTAAAKNGVSAATKTDLFAFFVYKSLEFMPKGARLGFVVSSSWLTADFGAPLQRLLLQKLRVVAIVGSTAESFFSQVDVNTVLVIVEKREKDGLTPGEQVKFVTLTKRLDELLTAQGRDYWEQVLSLTDMVEMTNQSKQLPGFRVVVTPAADELTALENAPKQSRNWSLFLRAPMLYFEIFGGAQ